jgi:hypothetical protein
MNAETAMSGRNCDVSQAVSEKESQRNIDKSHIASKAPMGSLYTRIIIKPQQPCLLIQQSKHLYRPPPTTYCAIRGNRNLEKCVVFLVSAEQRAPAREKVSPAREARLRRGSSRTTSAGRSSARRSSATSALTLRDDESCALGGVTVAVEK